MMRVEIFSFHFQLEDFQDLLVQHQLGHHDSTLLRNNVLTTLFQFRLIQYVFSVKYHYRTMYLELRFC